jgi:PPP family 3-phenylpropionic acid transporter
MPDVMARGIPKARLSGFYYCYFAILGCFIPYWPLYLESSGYSPQQIGWIMALVPATKIVSPALWGWLADRSGRILRLIRWASFLALICFSGLFTGPSVLGTQVAVLLAFSFCWNATLPLFEAVTLSHLTRHTALYSRIRLWGSVGFIVAVWGIGEMLDGMLLVAHLPLVMVALLSCQWLLSLMVPSPINEHAPDINTAVCDILGRREVIAFFIAALLLQVAHGPYYAFYSVFLEANDFTDGEIGELWALGVLAEILLFMFLGRLSRYINLRWMFLGSLVLSAVRWLLIALGFRHLGMLLIAQILHAASLGAAHAASIHIIHQNFRGPHHAKGQALFSGLCYGLGGALGSLYSGELWEPWGASGVFAAASGFSMLALWVAWPFIGRPAKRYSPTAKVVCGMDLADK